MFLCRPPRYYVTAVIQMISPIVRYGTQVESKMNIVERLKHYSELEPEVPANDEDTPTPDGWPNTGAIEFSKVCMRYQPELPLSLNQASFCIPGGARVGVCGRSGAGKSTLMNVLLRVNPLDSGTATIDGVDIVGVRLDDLRTKITIIPQDPVMFTGTMRYNLDPLGQKSDIECWTALEQVQMKGFIEQHSGLETSIEPGGHNLSIGQRQLVCMARALLRGTTVMMLDEATASIDNATDDAIQKVIRTGFVNSTVLVIAHRMRTITDSDLIVVMDAGKVAEFGSPQDLIAQGGIYADLVSTEHGASQR